MLNILLTTMETTEPVYSTVDTLWVLLGAALVFFMGAGFAMLEAGFTRAKNTGNILMKNFADFATGTVLFWIIGFGLMQGVGNGFIGSFDLFSLNLLAESDGTGVPMIVKLIFHTVFAATAATIVSGAMAERTKFKSYFLYSMVISGIVYPISGHWIWGGGWLSEIGFVDFAGSTAVHLVGGVSAFIGALFLGPRIGKYGKNGKVKAIPGSNIPMGALGVFILWFGWFGFNGASTYGLEGMEALAGHVFVTTNLSAVSGLLSALLFTWFKYKKPDVSMAMNGALAGLVGITAGTANVDPWAALVIGVTSGILMTLAVEFIDKVLKVDDPVGAVAVHGVCGAFGTLAVGLFDSKAGLFTTGSLDLLGVQALGVVSVLAWVVVTMTIVFFIIKKTIGLRVTRHEEITGLDIEEHGLASAYADFVATIPATGELSADVKTTTVIAPKSEAVPVEYKKAEKAYTSDDVKMSKVVVLMRPERFDNFKEAMNSIGITGMTVTNVLGCGMQKGSTEYYRGVPLEITLLPKTQVEIVVCKIPVETVVETAKASLYTGKIGDGKIFVYDVEQAIKVRTGEVGYDALQDVE